MWTTTERRGTPLLPIELSKWVGLHQVLYVGTEHAHEERLSTRLPVCLLRSDDVFVKDKLEEPYALNDDARISEDTMRAIYANPLYTYRGLNDLRHRLPADLREMYPFTTPDERLAHRIETIRKIYEAGGLREDAAKALNLDGAEISRIVALHLPQFSQAGRMQMKIEAIATMLKQGFRQSEIAKTLKMDEGWLSNIIKQYIRPTTETPNA